MDEDLELYKIVLIGNSGTGKTNITTRYIKGQFSEKSPPSIGAQFFAQSQTIKGKSIKINIWDTAGQQRYKSLSKVYYKGARGMLVVYDITDPQSYVDIEEWLRLANQTVELSNITVFVVGNKADLDSDRKVTYERALKELLVGFSQNWKEYQRNVSFDEIYQKGIQVKNSIFFGESQLVRYSEIDRDSMPFKRPLSKQMKPIQEVILQDRDQTFSNIMNTIDDPSIGRLTLTNTQRQSRIQQGKKKKSCCHH